MHKLLLRSHCLFLSEEGAGLQDLWAGRWELGSREDCGCLILKYYSRLSWGPARLRYGKKSSVKWALSSVWFIILQIHKHSTCNRAKTKHYSSANTLIYLSPTHAQVHDQY